MSKLIEDAKRIGMSDEEIEILRADEALGAESVLASGAGDAAPVASPAAPAAEPAVPPTPSVVATPPSPADSLPAAPIVDPVAAAPPEAAPEEVVAPAAVAVLKPAAAFAPQLTLDPLPENAKERLVAIRAEKEAGLQKMYDGDMDKTAYAKLANSLDDEAFEIRTAQQSAQFATQFNERMTTQLIDHTRVTFIHNSKTSGVDYSDPVNAGRLDRAFQLVAQDPEHKDKPLSDLYSVYEAAHEMVRLQVAATVKPQVPGAVVPGVPPVAPAPVVAAKPALTVVPKVPAARVTPPVTLAGMPAAAPPTVQDEAMAQVANLEGEALERHIAGMSKKDVDRLLRVVS